MSTFTRVRQTMALSKPHSKHQASLSFEAAFALAYGLRAIAAVSPQKPHESGITRRARELVGRYLDGLTPEQLRAEGRAVASSSKAHPVPHEDAQEAFQRLEAIDVGLPLPGLLSTRHGPSWTPMDAEALAAKVDGMVNEMYRSRFARREVQP